MQPGAITSWAEGFLRFTGKARVALVALVRDQQSNHVHLRPSTRLRLATAHVHLCKQCDKAFPTRQQAAVHEFKQHAIRPDIRYRLSGSQCLACLMLFSHGPALRNHCCNDSPKCGEWYADNVALLPTDIIEADIMADREWISSNDRKGKPRYRVIKPAGQLSGPLPKNAPDRHPFKPHRLYSCL